MKIQTLMIIYCAGVFCGTFFGILIAKAFAPKQQVVHVPVNNNYSGEQEVSHGVFVE